MVDLLLAYGADPGITMGEWHTTCLMVAIANNYTAVIERLLLHHRVISTINNEDMMDRTALYFASEAGHHDTVKLLLRHGADLVAGPCTPLIAATKNHHTAVVGSLLNDPRSFISLDLVNMSGRTAVWIACDKGYDDILTLLLRAGADPTIVDHDDRSPWHRARGHGNCFVLLEVSEAGVE